ncbi:MAG: hypothetical protein RMK43_04475 [Cyclobacteriaceae bacterium]|nr:hypothetical protein [Cyclobacteriaceae bacterium]
MKHGVKWILFIPLLFTMKVAGQSQSDIPDFRRAKVLKLNILSPVVETITLAYENVLTPEKSLQLTVSFIMGAGGFVITPEFRYYISETPAPQGVYLAPFLRYYQLEGGGILGGGLVLGKQAIFKNKITVDGFFGPSVNTIDVIDENEVIFGLRAGVTIGINLARTRK